MADDTNNPWAWRGNFSDELSNPSVRDRLIAYTNAEVGGEGPQAHQAFMETIFNRAAARDQSLRQTLSGPYFPDITHYRAARGATDQMREQYGPIIDQVLSGSNVANYATGNASGTVGFAGGPGTSKYGGERFGIEGHDAAWARNMGYDGQLPPMATAFGTQRGNNNMPGPNNTPALSANNTLGPGALNNGFVGLPGGGSYDFGTAGQNAGAWLMAPSTEGRSLSALMGVEYARKNQQDFLQQQQQIAATKQAYIQAGMDPMAAEAAARNATINQSAAPAYFGESKPAPVGSQEDAAGNKVTTYAVPVPGQPGKFRSIQIQDATGQPVQQQALPSSIYANGGTAQTQDDTLEGPDWLKQFSPKAQEFWKAQAEGRIPIAANLRRGEAAQLNTMAPLYGQKMGVPMDATSIGERQTMARDLGSESRTKAGGQLDSGLASLGHLYDTGTGIAALNNYNLGSQWVSQAANAVRGGNELAGLRAAADTARTKYAGESDQLITGGHSTISGREGQVAKLGLNEAQSVTAKVMRKEAEILADKYTPVLDKMDRLFGPAKSAPYRAELAKREQKVLDLADQMEGKAPSSAGTIPNTWDAAQKAGWK